MESKWDNFPDLGEAFEAVRGMLFGPLDAGFLRHKFGEIVRERVEKRDLETNPRGLFGLERDERELRDRKDRDQHHLTLTALLASNAEYRRAHEAAMAAFAAAGNAIDDAIEAGEKALADVTEKIEDYLASTPRLQDGRYVMFDPKDGLYKDQNFEVIKEEDLTAIDKEAVKEIIPYERMMAWKEKVTVEVDRQKGRRTEVGEWQNEATDQKSPSERETLEERTERSSDYEKDARKLQEMLSETPDYVSSKLIDEPSDESVVGIKETTVSTSTMAMPPMP